MAVTPTTTTGSRGLRIQGMPVRRWLRTTPGRLPRGFGPARRRAARLRHRHHRRDPGPQRRRPQGRTRVSSRARWRPRASTPAWPMPTPPPRRLPAGWPRAPAAARSLPSATSVDAGGYVATLAAVRRHLGRSSRQDPRRISDALTLVQRLRRVGTGQHHRQGNPVGSAYLAGLDDLMRDEILPATTRLYRDTAERLDDNYASGTSTFTLGVVLVAGFGMLALLVVVQVFVRRRSNRILNFGLVGATVLVVATLRMDAPPLRGGPRRARACASRRDPTRSRCSRRPGSSRCARRTTRTWH